MMWRLEYSSFTVPISRTSFVYRSTVVTYQPARMGGRPYCLYFDNRFPRLQAYLSFIPIHFISIHHIASISRCFSFFVLRPFPFPHAPTVEPVRVIVAESPFELPVVRLPSSSSPTGTGITAM